MLRVRLIVAAGEEDRFRPVAGRWRGAAPGDCVAPGRCLGRPETFDAAAFLGPLHPDRDIVAGLLHAGKHVLVGSESWPPPEELESLAEAARQAGVSFAAVNPDRYLPSRRLVRQQVGGSLGVPGLLRAHRWEATPPADPPAGLVRDLDLVLWLADAAPEVVYAAGSWPEFVQVHLGFAGGAMALLDYTARLPAGDGYQSLSVIGAAGAVYADDHANAQLVYQGGAARALPTGEGVGHVATLVQEFLDALATGQDWSDTVAACRRASAVADAARRSLETKGPVSLGAYS